MKESLHLWLKSCLIFLIRRPADDCQHDCQQSVDAAADVTCGERRPHVQEVADSHVHACRLYGTCRCPRTELPQPLLGIVCCVQSHTALSIQCASCTPLSR